MRRLRRALAGDAGSMTVTSAFVAAVVLAVAVGVLLVARASAAAHQARAAADLAALAGAHGVRAGADACGEARRIAAANSAGVVGCRVDGLDVVVRAGVPVELGGFGVWSAEAVARAGPA